MNRQEVLDFFKANREVHFNLERDAGDAVATAILTLAFAITEAANDIAAAIEKLDFTAESKKE